MINLVHQGGMRSKKADSSNPKVSIITATFNCVATLESTMKSVLEQEYRDYEYLVLDGGSSDGTLDLLRKYDGQIDYWISERDSGIYDAFNKAIDRARGDWLYFIGGDDIFADRSVLSRVFSCVHDSESLLIGNVIDENGNVFRSRLNWKTNIINTVHHQAAFYHRDLFRKFRYRSDARVVGDYELNYILYKTRVQYSYIDLIVSKCSSLGVSHVAPEFPSYIDMYRIRNSYAPTIMNAFYLSVGLSNCLRRKIETLL